MISNDRVTRRYYKLVILGLFLLYVNAQEVSKETLSAQSSSDLENQRRHWIIEAISKSDAVYLSQVQRVLDAINVKSEHPHSEKSRPTAAQSYGYGFLCVLFISTFSLAGVLAFPLMKRPFYKYFNAFFVSLAVGALFANSMFELIPAIITFSINEDEGPSNETHRNSSSKPDDKGSKVPLYLWQLLILVLTAYGFYVIEMMLNVFISYRNRKNQDGFELFSAEPGFLIESKEDEAKKGGMIGWMIIIGDGIHNVTDGLAIGAAFSESILLGVAQSVAIAFQELPSELGEIMILIDSGFTIRRALLFNFFSACTAFVGFFVGVAISENEHARIWIFSITAGTFIYIALVDLWPTLMPQTDRFDWVRFVCVTIGYITGVFVMFGLGVLTEEVVPKSSRG